jgi:large subunit ribosomal protein L19
VVAGEGVERFFPLHSPNRAKVDVERESVHMRTKLHYIRKCIAKEAMKVREKRR